MTTTLEGGEGSASRPGHSLPLGKTQYPLYRRLGGPQDRSWQVRKISPPPRFDPRIVRLVASRYTDYATRSTKGSVWYSGNKKELPVPRNCMFCCVKSRQYFKTPGTRDCWLLCWAFRSAGWRLFLPKSYKFSFSERVKDSLPLIASLRRHYTVSSDENLPTFRKMLRNELQTVYKMNHDLFVFTSLMGVNQVVWSVTIYTCILALIS